MASAFISSYLPLVADGLIVVGGLGLVSSLVSGNWFFFIPIATAKGANVANSWPPKFKHPVAYIRIWAFFVFNLTEDEAGIDKLKSQYAWNNDSGGTDVWGLYSWGASKVPEGNTQQSYGAAYGPLGADAGYGMVAAVVVGLAVKLFT